jgi:hypothetical protein
LTRWESENYRKKSEIRRAKSEGRRQKSPKGPQIGELKPAEALDRDLAEQANKAKTQKSKDSWPPAKFALKKTLKGNSRWAPSKRVC